MNENVEYEYQYQYQLLLKEIKHHKEDAESAKSTHYAAAQRNEKLYSSFLLWGFIITLLGVSCLLCLFINYVHFCQNWIGQSITLIGAGITLWPLIADYSGKAMSHRRSAEEYNSICKKCINWESDFPDKNYLGEARKDILIIRNSINFINNFSPRTTYSDFIKGRKNINAENYLYDSDKKNVSNNKNNDNMNEIVSGKNEITQKQNTQEAIRLLKAQRIAYSYSKRYGYIDLLIAIMSILIYCYASNMAETFFLNICLIIMIICSFIIVFSYKFQKKQILIGAGIQEKFDNEIFRLPQNMVLTPAYPSTEIIINYSSKYKKDDMHNWYMSYLKLDNYSLSIAILRCQLSNLLWDKIQRKAFKSVIFITLILIFTVISIVCYVNNSPFREFVERFILISPAIIYLFKVFYGQIEMIGNKDELIKHILDLLRRSDEGHMPTTAELRNIQDVIYGQRTKVSSTISDIWYKVRKHKTEKYVEQIFNNL
ncbi:MAG: hypothetical protein LBS55_06415 [Prevotellaceae bacterium]|jgi:hypothetical protein|nr:hypothetical protein [Prevotellaceae bacterium]